MMSAALTGGEKEQGLRDPQLSKEMASDLHFMRRNRLDTDSEFHQEIR